MARLAFGIAGAAVGYFAFGMPGLGYTIGSALGGMFESLPDVNQQGPRLNDLDVQSSAYGQMVPWICGTTSPPVNIIWSKPIDEVVTVQTQRSGGKGSPSQKVKTATYQYLATFAVALCEGEIAGLRRLWLNGGLEFNIGIGTNASAAAQSLLNWDGKLRVYTGSETQTVDPAIEAYEGVGESSAYRGTAYLLFDELDVTEVGTIPLIKAEVVKSGSLGTAINYYTSGGTTSTTQHSYALYDAAHGEIWLDDPLYDGGGGGGWPDRYAIYNLAAGTFSFIVLPSDFKQITTNNGPFLHIAPEFDVMYAISRSVSASFHDTTAYSLSTKTKLGQFSDVILTEPSGIEIIGYNPDPLQATALVNLTIGGLVIVEVSPSTGLPLAESYLKVFTGVPGPGAGVRAFTDNSGSYWLPYGGSSDIWKLNILGRTVYAPGADGRAGNSAAWCHDPTRDCFYFWSDTGAGEYLKKIDCVTGTISRVNSSAYATSGSFPSDGTLMYAADIDKVVSVKSADAVFLLDPVDGSIDATYAITGGSGNKFNGYTSYAPGVVWGTSGGATTGGVAELRFNALTEAAPTLQSVFTEISAKVGIQSGQLNISNLAAYTVPGYGIYRVGTARAAVDPLLLHYSFRCVDSDLKVKSVLCGGAPALALTEDDLGAAPSGDKAPRLTVSRAQEAEVPRECRLSYIDRNANYAIGMQYERRLGGYSTDIQEISTTLVLTEDQARQSVAKILYGQHASRLSLEWSVDSRCLWYEPTDVFTITRGAIAYNVSASEKRETQSLSKWVGSTEDANIYTQSMSGAPLAVATMTLYGLVATHLDILDIPVLREVDAPTNGAYLSGVGVAAGWKGAEVFKSSDGVNYTTTGVSLSPGGATGFCTTELGDFNGGNVFDETNILTAKFYPGSAALSSVSREACLQGENHFVIGINGRFEVVGARDITLIAAETYTFAGLLRGRCGTEQYMGTHLIGDFCVAVEPGAIARIDIPTSDVGYVKSYKPVSLGMTVIQTTGYPFTFQNVGKMCLSPVGLRGERDISSNLVGTFMRRVRGVALGWGDADLPLNEPSLLFDVEIWNSTYTTLKRTFADLTTESFSYTSAQQVTDFGSNQNPVYVRIYQKNPERGYVLQGSI